MRRLAGSYDVIGIMLRLWNEQGKDNENRCCTPDAMALARRIAARLGIPFYVMDIQQQFHNIVVNFFIGGYTQGQTPNPCLVCNKKIRWELLLNHAMSLDADYLATGHYARIGRPGGGEFQLLKAVDVDKDQSYVLHVLSQQQLSHALVPVGSLKKAEVREIARNLNLPVSNRPDSQDLCFLGDYDYRSFLSRHAAAKLIPGPIEDRHGRSGRNSGCIGTPGGIPIPRPTRRAFRRAYA